MKSIQALTVLEELGGAQWGLVTSAQAVSRGVDRVTLGRLADRGAVQRLRHGVYALPSAGSGPLQDVRAAWLATGPSLDVDERALGEPEVVVSHLSAAVAHGLGDLLASRHHFTSPVRRQTSQLDVRFHRSSLVAGDWVLLDGLPVTSVVRTVADLVRDGIDLDHLAPVLRDALQVAPGTYGALAEALSPAAAMYGHGSGEDLVASCLRSAGLPETARDVLEHQSEAWGRAIASQVQRSIEPSLRQAFQQVALASPATADQVADACAALIASSFWDALRDLEGQGNPLLYVAESPGHGGRRAPRR